MSTTMRYAAALGFVGAVAIAGTAFGQGPGGGPELAGTSLDPGASNEHARFAGGPMMGHRAGGFGRVVTSTTTVQTEDGFATHRIDTGTVTGVDGQTVTIERADGETISVTATEDTRIARDGETAEVSDLRTGDHAVLLRRDEGAGFVLRGIRALSPEAYERRSAERDERTDRRRARIERWRERFAERTDPPAESDAA